ncbi:MAG TPA: hypothetical protein VJ417_13740, partial [Candidatus Glassbacteria bacterium]|nr:hypothetical protein [Candidatus Glassbacteria bacterium]
MRLKVCIPILFSLTAIAVQWSALPAQISDNGYALMMRQVFGFVCLNCHDSNKTGGSRNGAPSSVNWDTYTLAHVSAVKGNLRVQAGTMPPASAGGALNSTRKSAFQAWVDAKMPLGPVVDYQDVRDSLFVPVCLNCHDSNKSGAARNGAPVNVNWDTYALAAASAANGNTQVQQGTMPPSGTLTASQKAIFEDWVNLDIPSGRVVTYYDLADSLFTPNCILCHDSKNTIPARNFAPVDVNFDTDSAAVAVFDRFNNRIHSGSQHPAGFTPSAAQKLQVFDWIYAGFPEGERGIVCDLNEDGAAAVSDVISLLLIIRDNVFDAAYDYNGDGRFSISDAVMLVLLIRNGNCAE